MEKIVLIVNGNPGSGKSTFQKIIQSKVNSIIYSSIDYVKDVYTTYFGWNGEKREVNRKFLSDMKHFLIAETNLIDEVLTDKYNEFLTSDSRILMIDIREADEIKKYAQKFNAKTLLITNPRSKTILSNNSDNQVLDYPYDMEIINNGTLLELENKVEKFLKSSFKDNQKELYFQNYFGQDRFVCMINSLEDAFQNIDDFLKDWNHRKPNLQYWLEDNGNLKIDIESQSEFFIIKDGKELFI